MKKIIKQNQLMKASLIFLFGMLIACSKEEIPETEEASSIETSVLDSNNLSAKQTCTERSFPRLGPNTTLSQTCPDPANAVNIGTLDCRSRGAGGYSQQKIGSRTFGVYKLRGGPERYDGTRTRVERSFKNIENAKNSFLTFTSLFMITDLGDSPTNITQLHAGSDNKILFGSRAGQLARSAVMALAASKTSNPNRFELTVSQTTVPFTSTQRGKRIRRHFRNITKGVLYRLTVTTGFNAKRRAVTRYSVARVNNTNDKKSTTINHTFTTGELSLRYGAYETADRGDVGAEIRFANTQLCRSN